MMGRCEAPACSLETEGKYCLAHHKRDLYLRRTYGMTLADYYEILEYQEGVCYLCKKPPRPDENLTVDHDHVTRQTRGLLCTYCNRRVIGRHRDFRILYAAAHYLEYPPALMALGEPRFAPKKKRKKRHRPIKRVASH